MTRSELIRQVADSVTEIDVLRSSVSRGTSERIQLDELRDDLDTRVNRLSVRNFEENSGRFLEFSEAISDINADLQVTIDDVNNRVTTINNLKRLVGAVDQLIGIGRLIV
jgi:hypothetical protein